MLSYTEFTPNTFREWMTVIEYGIEAKQLSRREGHNKPFHELIVAWNAPSRIKHTVVAIEKGEWNNVLSPDGVILQQSWKWFDLKTVCIDHLRAYPLFKSGKLDVFIATIVALGHTEGFHYSLDFDLNELYFVDEDNELTVGYPGEIAPFSTPNDELWEQAATAFNLFNIGEN